MKRIRRKFTPKEKVNILRLHIFEKKSILDLCNEYGIHPTVLYRWKKQLFDLGEEAFRRNHPKSIIAKQKLQKTLTKNKKEEDSRKWMLELIQGKYDHSHLMPVFLKYLQLSELQMLIDCIKNRPLRYRNRAVFVLAHLKGIPVPAISRFLFIPRQTVHLWVQVYKNRGCTDFLNPPYLPEYRKCKDKKYIDAVFAIIHAPPKTYGINRTSWRQSDVQTVMKKEGISISKQYIGKIIKDAGYQYRKAKKVLTSIDPDYHEKLKKITGILSRLGPMEKFFSIDEFGPFAVKIQGGTSLVKRGHAKVVPKYQKSKGSLILTGALELSTNQMIHFYSEKKNTMEMIKLLNLLLNKYPNEDCLYLSWDAGSWHASKELYERIDEVNTFKRGRPRVELAPLPASAQFLNVIESVFSGMARAVIHNSDYTSVEECKRAIDLHFKERNVHFRKNPKRAGNKIWGKERVTPEFNVGNNCKDPRYSR
ncbi:MAG: IS630 family transposase [Sedimentisphaerales bacterium]|nr:IS630 family transposase [Sedimentisphaerales bacterium]